jgi:hypothetical protein
MNNVQAFIFIAIMKMRKYRDAENAKEKNRNKQK